MSLFESALFLDRAAVPAVVGKSLVARAALIALMGYFFAPKAAR